LQQVERPFDVKHGFGVIIFQCHLLMKQAGKEQHLIKESFFVNPDPEELITLGP
jgi:hypothetical protein